MFRHVYSLRGTNYNPNQFKLSISRNSSTNIIEYSPPGANFTYLTLFGFDLENSQGQPGADGFVDNCPALINYQLGELHFLDLTPFNPSGYYDPYNSLTPTVYPLDSLELVISDSVGFVAPYLYNTVPTSIPQHGAKWQFQVDYN